MGSDDLFGSDSDDDGNDTDDLIASARETESKRAPAAKKKLGAAKKKGGGGGGKKRLQKGSPADTKKKIPDADNDSDDSDDDMFGGGAGMSKKEKMDALMRAKRSKTGADEREERERRPKRGGGEGGDDGGAVSDAGSVDSVNFQRTQEDDDFIDNDDEDPDAMKELYAEQHFDDEVPENDDFEDNDPEGRYKKGRGGGGGRSGSSKKRKSGPDQLSDLDDDEEPSNPLMKVVKEMKRKKKVKKTVGEREVEASELIEKMNTAAADDELAMKKRQPAMKKLSMMNTVLDALAKKDMWRPLLENDLLAVCKRWIQPLPNKTLGNVTLRRNILQSLGMMNGEDGISSRDLKESGFGKTVMSLYVHRDETPEMKRLHKTLVEQWSRPIFNKSGNMKDLGKVHRGGGGLSAIAMQQSASSSYAAAAAAASSPGAGGGKGKQDFSSLVAKGSVKGTVDLGNNRVRVPFSKGFQFTVRPQNKEIDHDTSRARSQNSVKETRSDMNKRMIERGRAGKKNLRSLNISVEGRSVK